MSARCFGFVELVLTLECEVTGVVGVVGLEFGMGIGEGDEFGDGAGCDVAARYVGGHSGGVVGIALVVIVLG